MLQKTTTEVNTPVKDKDETTRFYKNRKKAYLQAYLWSTARFPFGLEKE